MNNLSGQTIKGYDLQERIGAGGFGAVYRAVQSTVGREVAVKIILPGLASKPDFIRRFESEAHLIARLEHPYIVPLYDYWRDPDGAYLVMRWLRGGSLQHILKTHGAYSIEEAVAMMEQITQALHTAHRNQVIHRDIKPANILLDDDGNAYLADFGIAKDHAITQGVTEVDAVVGSPDYLAPEQARSEPVTPRTDIYSLGVVLYEMLAGEHPFPNLSPIEQLFKHLNQPLPDISTLDDNIRDSMNLVVQKATAKNPQERYKDVLEFIQALRDAAQLGSSQVTTSLVELLTPREQEVLQLMINGKSNKEIADALVVEVATIKWYNRQIFRKLNVRSRVQAVVKARELELVLGKPNGANATTGHLPEPENPYKGLRAFQAADAQDFFGREKLTQKLLHRLQEDVQFKRFLAIVGPSGSGKSSVVRAGLIPALWRGEMKGSDKWYIVDMLPGDRPLDELEVTLLRVAGDHSLNIRDQLERDANGLIRAASLILPDDGSELLVVIDQFEEVFTLVEKEADRQHFLSLLLEAVTKERSRVRIMVTLRADYYDRPLQYPDFGELMRSRVETVLPLGASELERAIREPALMEGVQFEDGLVSRIVADVNYQPGALPLLQYALTELFERRKGRTLTQAAYLELGGTGGALAKRADELYLEYDENGREQIHQLFLRLVTLGEGAEDTRRRVNRSELLAIAAPPLYSSVRNEPALMERGLGGEVEVMDDIIDTYAASRLLSLDHDPATRTPTVEVAHEAILREWDRLRAWLNESREDIRQERIVAQAADAWKANQRDSSYLLSGTRLEQVEKWQKSTELALTPLERDFIAASITQRAAHQKAEVERQAREILLENRSRNFLRGLVAVFAFATLIAGGLSILAFALNNQSRRSSDEFRSIALTFGAQDALDNGQPDVALALAREAVNMDEPPFEAEQMFYDAGSSTWIQHRYLVSDTRVWDAIYHPDGERIITSSWDGRVVIWDVATERELHSVQVDGRLNYIAVHPDGNIIAFGSRDNGMQLWNVDTGEITELVTSDGINSAPVFTKDGTQLIMASSGIIYIWDMETLEIVRSFESPDDTFIKSTRFSLDGHLLITAGDNYARIWDFNTGELLQELDHRPTETTSTAFVWNAQFLHNGEWVISAADFKVTLWDWQSGQIIWAVETPRLVQDIAVTPDEQWFIAGLEGPPAAQLYHIPTGRLIRDYFGHSSRTQNVDISPDGTHFITGSNDGTVVAWPLWWEGAQRIIPIALDEVWSIAQHPTQPFVAIGTGNNQELIETGKYDGTIYIINTVTGETIQELVAHRQAIGSLTFSPDGHYLLSGDYDASAGDDNQQLYVWDWEKGELISEFSEHVGWVNTIAVSPDGRLVASGDASGRQIFIWDLQTGEIIHHLLGHQDWVRAVVFSPDGNWLYSAGRDKTIFRWDVNSGELVQEYGDRAYSIRRLALTSDGTRLIASAYEDKINIFDTSSGDLLNTLNAGGDISLKSDNTQLAVYSYTDGVISVRDLATGEEQYRFSAYSPEIEGVLTFDYTSNQLISAANGHIIVWDVLTAANDIAMGLQNTRYIPDFTCVHRELYRIEPRCESE